MLSAKRAISIIFLLLIHGALFAQSGIDLGFKLNASPRNRFRLELRKFTSDKTAFRVTLSMSAPYEGKSYSMLGANDSIVFVRETLSRKYNSELRAGVQYKLGASRFKIDGDLVFCYSPVQSYRYTKRAIRTDFYDDPSKPHPTEYLAQVQNSTRAKWLDGGFGLSLGLSWEYALGQRTSICLYSGAVATWMRTYGYSERDDFLNEFDRSMQFIGTEFRYYLNAGIGMNFKLGK